MPVDPKNPRKYRSSVSEILEPLQLDLQGESGEWETFFINADLDVDVMEAMTEIEQQIKAPRSDENDEAVYETVKAGRALIGNLIRECPYNEGRFPARLPGGIGEILSIFAWLLGGNTASDEVAQALADADLFGSEREATGETVAEPESEVDEAADTAPLSQASSGATSSSTRSTRRGRRTSGAGSRGGSSAPTSKKRAAS